VTALIANNKIARMLKRGWVLWLLVLVGWMLIGSSFTLNYYLFSQHYVAIFKQPPSLREMAVWELPYWVLWAALSPLIFRIARHFRLDRESWPRSVLVHISACLFISIAHRTIYLFVCWLLHVAAYQQLTSISQLYNLFVFFNLPTGFMSYAAFLLVSHAIVYYHRYQEGEVKASRLEAELVQAQLQVAQAELQALKMQLHPHFLFNTLNSISSLLEEDPEAADEMIARLGDFLRLTLENSGAQEVTLQEELEFLRCYLEIERVRFQDRLSVGLQVEPDALEARVPNLILQPIVENAIRHGITARLAAGRIDIQATCNDQVLRLRVTDNGPGLAAAGAGSLKEGLGLANTRARLEQLYPAAHRFELASVAEGGLQVLLEIPFETKTSIPSAQRVIV
jgi:two-component system, LytTR family, sensor kinase